MESLRPKQLNSNFITGFIDAEGCFHISIVNSKSNKIGKSVRTIFQISLRTPAGLEKDKSLLHQPLGPDPKVLGPGSKE